LSSTGAAAAKAHRQDSAVTWITRPVVFTAIEAEDLTAGQWKQSESDYGIDADGQDLAESSLVTTVPR